MRGIVVTLLAVVIPWIAGPASAATYVFYGPGSANVGGASTEVYVPATFEAHEGLAGAALVDASLKELGTLLGEELKSINVVFKGTVAEITVDKKALGRPEIVDRALGAVFHTLRMAGATAVLWQGRLVDPSSFSRGALLPVLDLAAALPPTHLAHGYVRVGTSLWAAGEFYQKLSAGDPMIREAGLQLLAASSKWVKLRLIAAIDTLRLSNRDAALILRLKDPDLDVRLAVLKVFERSRRPVVFDALKELVLTDKEADVKIAAVKILVGAGMKKYKK